MKTLRLVLALGFLSAFAIGLARAADDKKPAEAKNPAGCDCGTDKDGKVCGVDKDCCCTGQKATKTADKKDDKGEKKSEKKDEKKDAKKTG